MPFADRLRRLREAIDLRKDEAILVSSPTNVAYLTGFGGDSSTLLVARDREIIVSDGRFIDQLAQECPGLEAEFRPIGLTMTAGVAGLVGRLGLGHLKVEADAMTVADFESLRDATDPVALETTRGLVERLRMIKDDSEILAIREAVAIAERAFDDLRGWLKPGVHEKDTADFLDSAIRQRGGVGASFATIVAFGARAALPHARPDPISKLGPAQVALVDWGAAGPSYKSDLTRIVTTGKVTREFESAYRAVLDAQRQAIAAIRPGVLAREVDARARSVLEDAGLGPLFTHSTGHGIGREVHEAPVLRATTETPLVAGMVLTVEPGVYDPTWGGIRIEDDILVTEDGCEVLSRLPKGLESVRL